jgi:vacuolar-type H+-ATPase subunit I/STV1
VVLPHTRCPLCERAQLLLEQQPAPLPPDLSETEEELRKATQLVASLQKQLTARREEHLKEIEAYWRRLLAQASLHTVAKMLNQALHTAHAAGVPLDDLTQWAQSDEVWKNR